MIAASAHKRWYWLGVALVVAGIAAAVIAEGIVRRRRLSSYAPQEGDIVFQSLSGSDLVDAIEGVTHSELSHCGIVFLRGGSWHVIEALGRVRMTPLPTWVARGEGWRFCAYRLTPEFETQIPAIIEAAMKYEGRPYDLHYRMGDDAIYCSELVYKAIRDATGRNVGTLERLGDLDWEPYRATIERYENGGVPLDREMITPAGLTRADELVRAYGAGL